MNKLRIFSAALLVSIVAFAAHDAIAGTDHPPHVAPPVAEVSAPLLLAVSGADYAGEFFASFASFAQGVRDEEARIAADEMAALEAARRNPVSRVSGGGTYEGVGDCTGFAIPDYIIQRESGGNPYAVNSSSGAFGCAQVMPFHWSPGGACAGLDRYSIDDQRTCVDWLSEGGTRLSPWAATR